MQPKQSVLIIDDSPLIVKILKDMLKSDYTVFSAFTGQDGLTMAMENMPDLIILDIVMAPMDGYEICRQLKANTITKNIPVIFITALNEMEDEKKGLEIGAIDYITKPFCEPIVKIRVKNHIELKQHRDFLSTLSAIDGLTGIHNRRYFDTKFQEEWDKAIINETPLSIILIDIDRFKKYNDTLGHLEGDECLRLVAKCIQDSAEKGGNIVSRFGGEEFVCLMPNTPAEVAVDVAFSIFKSVNKCNIPFAASDISSNVTISAGLKTVVPSNAIIKEDFLKSVDDLLYKAKRQGRNQLVVE